ncbi:alkaline phosphatase D family protein [Kitasatospora sp. NPDC003701]
MDDSSRTLSDHINSEISRRRVVQLLGVGAAAVAAGGAMTGTAAAAVDPLPPTGLVAAVLEYADRWTNAVGLRKLLVHAGFTVIDLDPTKAATAQARPVDLIAFGSFTNDGPHYTKYVKDHVESLRAFTTAGGVILDLAKSDQPGEGVSYLPTANWTWNTSGPYAVRTDADFDTVYPVATTHPLVSALPKDASGQVFTGRNSTFDGLKVWTSWESIGAWKEMRVLLACAPGTAGFPAALLEGRDTILENGSWKADGKGRYLVSSLTVDKCYRADGTAVQNAAAIDDSRTFFNALSGYVQMVKGRSAPAVTYTLSSQAGPLVGHVGVSTARIWARPGLTGSWKCEVKEGTAVKATVTASTVAANDDTVLFDVQGLTASTSYTYTITPVASGVACVPMQGGFTTAPGTGVAAKVTLGVGSCAHNVPNHLWTRVLNEGCEGFVMLGDTPYADSDGHPALPGATKRSVEVVRAYYREFIAVPELANMARSMPVWGTWDDHDFGANDSDGTLADKATYRRAFVDYRANATFGHTTGGTQPLTDRTPGEGVYTSFRRGPIEMFLIDPRWFSNKNGTVCMGPVQKQWLFNALSASSATFKVLASGMTWYDKPGGEKDDWANYAAEKDEIFNYINQKKIRGCVLLSGDIHVSRALKNNGTTPVGYDLWEYIVSPIHRITLGPTFDVATPGVVHSKAEPYTFLKLVADTTVAPARLTATWINRDGASVIGPIVLTTTQLGYPA